MAGRAKGDTHGGGPNLTVVLPSGPRPRAKRERSEVRPSTQRRRPEPSMMRRLELGILEQVERWPERKAVVDGTESLTYRALDSRASRLAGLLRGHGLEPGDRVALLSKKSAHAVMAVHGILKAGGTYVPLDPRSPSRRLSSILRSCAPCWLLATRDARDLVEGWLAQSDAIAFHGVFWLETTPHDSGVATIAAECRRDPKNGAADTGSTDLAYIMFTSGSTGEPKGVPITHDSVLGFLEGARGRFGLQPDDRCAAHSPLHFDLSVFDVFGTLTSGAELHVVPDQLAVLPTTLAHYIRDSRITHWLSVPSALVPMVGRDVLTHESFPELRRLLWCGDVLPTAHLRYLMQRLPRVSFVNLYGPTEATVACTYHLVSEIPSRDDEQVPIGTPLPGRRVAVLDADQRPLPRHAVGELYIGGTGLSPGYWQDPVETARTFQTVPGLEGRWYRSGDLAELDASGVLHFHGRMGRMVKTRGCRVELDDVAAALARLTLAEVAAVGIPVGGVEGTRICAAWVSLPGDERGADALRSELATLLPAYMLPRAWCRLPELPKSASGKVDHRSLESLFKSEGQ